MRERHDANDGIATLAATRVADTSEYGVVVIRRRRPRAGLPGEARPRRGALRPRQLQDLHVRAEIFDYFPDADVVDFALDVFPALLENDVPFYVHEVDAYWNDVGSLDEYRQGNFDAVSGVVEVELDGEVAGAGGDARSSGAGPRSAAAVLAGADCQVGAGVRLDGPVVLGAGPRSARARVPQSVILTGATSAGAFAVRAVLGPRRG